MTEQAQAKVASGKDMPSGMLIPAQIKDIRDGRFLTELQQALITTIAALSEHHEKTGDKRATAKIKIVLEIGATPGMDDSLDVLDNITRTLPTPKKKSMYPLRNGRMLVEGTQERVASRDPEEIVPFFDFMGVNKGSVDPSTLKVVEDDDTAGRISAAG